jgi:ABC-type sugar transport system ATPase subunit
MTETSAPFRGAVPRHGREPRRCGTGRSSQSAKRNPAFVALDWLNLTIPDSTLPVLQALSDRGKTTTIRVIAGAHVNELGPQDRDPAMVLLSCAPCPDMTVFEPMRVPPAGVPDADAQVKCAAQMVELTDFLHRRPSQLLGGQRQRAALAHASVRKTDGGIKRVGPRYFKYDHDYVPLAAAS